MQQKKKVSLFYFQNKSHYGVYIHSEKNEIAYCVYNFKYLPLNSRTNPLSFISFSDVCKKATGILIGFFEVDLPDFIRILNFDGIFDIFFAWT